MGRDDTSCNKTFHGMALKKMCTGSRAMSANAIFRKDSNTVICPQFLLCSVYKELLTWISPQKTPTPTCKMKSPKNYRDMNYREELASGRALIICAGATMVHDVILCI